MARGEIKSYYKFWVDTFPDSEMTRESFFKFAAIAFDADLIAKEMSDDTFYLTDVRTRGDDHHVSKYDFLFQAMDRDHDGIVTFIDFLAFQSITTAHHLNYEKLIDVVFDVYSGKNTFYSTTTTTKQSNSTTTITTEEYITRSDMIRALEDLFVACNVPVDQEAIERRVDWLLLDTDPKGDGRVTKQEIVKACRRYPSLLVLF